MPGEWMDWMAVGLAVAGAVGWLALRIRRQWKKQKQASNPACACGTSCDGCPFARNCGDPPKLNH